MAVSTYQVKNPGTGKMPSGKQLTAALRNVRLYHGILRDGSKNKVAVGKLRARADASITSIARLSGNPLKNTQIQLENIAKQHGVIVPVAGRDF